MFEARKSTGTAYTITIALLAVAFVFVPAVIIVSRSFGYISLSLGIATSVCSVALAAILWKKSSQLFIPSIAVRGRTAK